jgi:hypothetical protein
MANPIKVSARVFNFPGFPSPQELFLRFLRYLRCLMFNSERIVTAWANSTGNRIHFDLVVLNAFKTIYESFR